MNQLVNQVQFLREVALFFLFCIIAEIFFYFHLIFKPIKRSHLYCNTHLIHHYLYLQPQTSFSSSQRRTAAGYDCAWSGSSASQLRRWRGGWDPRTGGGADERDQQYLVKVQTWVGLLLSLVLQTEEPHLHCILCILVSQFLWTLLK